MKYIHEKKNQIKSALFHAGEITRNPFLFEIVFDEEDKQVDPSGITRKNELVGAGIQYTMSIVDYFCTHQRNDLQVVEGSAKRIKIPTLTWKMAIDIATARLPGQRRRAEAAILNLNAAQKPVFFYDFDYEKNGRSYLMIPFIIDLTFEDGEKLTASSAAKLARVIKARQSKETKGEILKGKIDQPYKVIQYIDIQFAKPLYEGFFRKGTGNYSFPNGMYAQFFDYANAMKKTSVEITKRDQRFSILADMDSEPYIDFYCRFARYIQLHNNLEKGKDHTVIHKGITEIMTAVYPTLMQWINGKPYIRDKTEAITMIGSGISAMQMLEGFYAYPSIEGILSDGKVCIGLYRDREKAEAATSKWLEGTQNEG
jgi:hypothetical protein